MSFSINIQDNINRIAKDLDVMEKQQLPFAVKLTLNKLAVNAQEDICRNIQKVFNNSNRWYDKRQRTGIKVSFASKSDPVAAVYTKVHFAYIQEEGGIRIPYFGSHLAIPTDKIPKRSKGSKELRYARGDKTIFKLGSSIYKRISNQSLQRLYSLSPQGTIKARLGFKDTAVKSFNKGFDRVFTDCFNYALKTAR